MCTYNTISTCDRWKLNSAEFATGTKIMDLDNVYESSDSSVRGDVRGENREMK